MSGSYMSGSYGYTRRNAAPFAGWFSRVLATIIDAIPPIVVAFIADATFGTTSETSDNRPSIDLSAAGLALIYGFALVWFIYNTVYRQGTTGQTIGKTMLGIAVYRAGTAEPIGAALSFVRQLVHLVDSITCYLGYLWPLWDSQKRTFADMIMSTRVYHATTMNTRM
jgi:uncharacterized RDD family membrane protein YckC